MFFGVNGRAPGSWNTIVTMSFPMCLFLRSCKRRKEIIKYLEKKMFVPHYQDPHTVNK